MEREVPLDGLRRRVGLEAALVGIVAEPEVAAHLRPAVERVLLNVGDSHGLGETASLTPYGPFAFSKAFRGATGMSFFEFLDRARVDAALLRLATTNEPVERVARDHGFLSKRTLDLSLGEYTGIPLAAVLALLRP